VFVGCIYGLVFHYTTIVNSGWSEFINIKFSWSDILHYLSFKLFCILLLSSLYLDLMRSYYFHSVLICFFSSLGLYYHFVIRKPSWGIAAVACITTTLIVRRIRFMHDKTPILWWLFLPKYFFIRVLLAFFHLFIGSIFNGLFLSWMGSLWLLHFFPWAYFV